MNGSPSSRAKYASLTAVEPLDASTTVVPSCSQPLHSAYRNSERASRCLRLPVGCVDSSFKYRSMPCTANAGSGSGTRCVSALRQKSASMRRTASCTHGSTLLTSLLRLETRGADHRAPAVVVVLHD